MVTVQSTPGLIARYRELLVSDWNKSLPRDVLSLLWAIVGQEATGKAEPLLQFLNPNDTAAFPLDIFRSIVARIADGTRFVRLAELPPLRPDYLPPKKPSSIARQACLLTTYLTLSAHTTVTGNTDFLADVQALAFQASLHFVLPELQKKHEVEHALLLHSALLFSVGYSAYEPAHYAYMTSMIHGYLGDEEQRLRSLFASFRFTPPEDHSYLTKAQEFWTELLDQNKTEEAERFLLSLHWWSLPAQQDEVREMVVDAFKYILTSHRGRE